MKKTQFLITVTLISVVIAILTIGNVSIGENAIAQNQKNIGDNQIKQVDTSKIIINIPAVKCGNVKWDEPTIIDWLKNYCLDKCDDPNSSGFKFSGIIKNSKKSWSLKVTIKTDREYLQPVKFNPIDGIFEGKIYFDKTNRMETPIKVTLRDSNRLTIETFIITLTE